MRIAHHPDITTVMTCSAGSQPEALCSVVTSHLSMCPACMHELRLLEEIGVGLFECSPSDQSVPAGKVPSAVDILEHAREAAHEPQNGEIPWPLIPILGTSLDALAWDDIGPGIATVSIPLSPNAKGDLRLLRLDPGEQLPEHDHVGEELTLVLRGSYTDATGSFKVGDMSDLDDEQRHSVLAGRDGCIVLIASERPPAFLAGLARSAA